jgi:hypothetical protein
MAWLHNVCLLLVVEYSYELAHTNQHIDFCWLSELVDSARHKPACAFV